MDYKNGKIYKITSDSTNKIYIGSTCQPLSKRIADHRDSYKQFINNKRNRIITCYELIKLGDAIITLIEDFPCESKEQLHARERYYIELHKDICVNKKIPTRTTKEWQVENKESLALYKKQYRIDNKEKIKQYNIDNKEKMALYHKQYRIDNKEKIALRKKQDRIDKKEKLAKERATLS